MASEIIGGIEGGASNSTAVLLSPEGTILATVKGQGTNHYLIGMEECAKRIAGLINEAKNQASIPLDSPIGALGLYLSGCETPETNEALAKQLKDKYPKLSLQYAVGADTEGSIAAASGRGGVVCIAGTGSCTLLINPDGRKVQCGGWGNLLGDEGSAYNISWKAIKYHLDHWDKFRIAPYSTDKIWAAIKKHFNITTERDLLAPFYSEFDKSRIALLCKSLAELAHNGDALSKHLFWEAGQDLARSIAGVAVDASLELKNIQGGLHVLCVGSVWLSWNLLKDGFMDYVENSTSFPELTLLRLKTECGVGAALKASDTLNLRLDRDYSKNYDAFLSYKRSECASSCKKVS